MRKVFFIILCLIQLSTFAQEGYYRPEKKIQTSDLSISRTGTHNIIKLYYSKKAVIETLGKPLEIKRSYFVKFDFRGEEVKYNDAAFYFMDDRLVAFEITNSKFELTINNMKEPVIVGSFLKALKKPHDKNMSILLCQNNIPIDKTLRLLLDSSNKVTYIGCGPD